MLTCKYCGGSGKLHDDADAFDDHEVERAEAELADIRLQKEQTQAERDALVVSRHASQAELARVTAEAAVLREAVASLWQICQEDGSIGYEQAEAHCPQAISSTSAGAGLLKRLEAAEAVCDAAADIRCQVGDDMGKPWRRFIYALRDWKRARGEGEREPR